MWYVGNPVRFREEQQALQELESQVDWLQVLEWRIEPTSHLCVDVDLDLGRLYPVTLRYSINFPFTPPSVAPRVLERWSGHQYGMGGELCLEYGPDNWRQELTGADMLRSTERLLRTEAESDGGRRDSIPSRHATTVGQDLRGTYVRVLVTEPLCRCLADMPVGKTLQVKYRGLYRENSYVVVPSEISRPSADAWVDPSVPGAIEHFAQKWSGLGLVLPNDVTVPNFSTGSELKTYLTTYGFELPEGYSPDSFEFVLLHAGNKSELFWIAKDDDTVHRCRAIVPSGGQRLDTEHIALGAKTVGIVGCGSLGSKIATMLARSGVRAFVLIDDDVFVPENLVRHELDWISMGEHKVDAVARRIALVSPGATCNIRRQRLGGQEASGGTDWSLTLLRGCDLIVDATAEPSVFNLLSSIVQTAERSLVWAQVFAGGIGGLVARARPSLDPDPQTARARIAGWCDEQGVTVPAPGVDYDRVQDGIPLIADDADVTVIAAHATRMCVDTLLSRAPSWFPVSVYLIGLARGWIFSQPFHTWPVDVGEPVQIQRAQSPADTAHIATILQLMSKRKDEPPTSP